MASRKRPLAWLSSCALALLVSNAASAHDPYEITADAHLDVYGLNVHTTLSLDSAARICLAGSAPARRIVAADFTQFRARLQRCAREFYALTAADERLALLSLSVSLSSEDDLEVRGVYAPPAASPLGFEASLLKGLGPELAAGVLLTATGKRSFLAQKLLTAADPRLQVAITPEGESLGTPASGLAGDVAPGKPGLRLTPVLVLGALALVLLLFARRNRR